MDELWPDTLPSLGDTRDQILRAMIDLHECATDTVWLTKTETVFERLAAIYVCAGGHPATLAELWPEYYDT